MKYDLDKIIPQKPPMRLIDRVISLVDQTVHCQAEITPKHIFYNEKVQSIPHWAGVEMMAQTAASYGALISENTSSGGGVAFLMSIRQYKATVKEFKQGQVLDVYATCSLLEGGVGVFNCNIDIAGETVASVVMSAYQPKSIEEAKSVLKRSDS